LVFGGGGQGILQGDTVLELSGQWESQALEKLGESWLGFDKLHRVKIPRNRVFFGWNLGESFCA